MGAEEKGSHKERVEAMQKKFDVRLLCITDHHITILHTCAYYNVCCLESVLYI